MMIILLVTADQPNHPNHHDNEDNDHHHHHSQYDHDNEDDGQGEGDVFEDRRRQMPWTTSPFSIQPTLWQGLLF